MTLAAQLAGSLRGGTETVVDARRTLHLIREAQGWLLAAERFLDPGDPAGGVGP